MRVFSIMLAGAIFVSGCMSARVPDSAAHVQPASRQQPPLMVTSATPQNPNVIKTAPLYTPGVEQPDPMSARATEIRDAGLEGTVLRAPQIVVTEPLAGQPGNGKLVGQTYPTQDTVSGADEASDVAAQALNIFGKRPTTPTVTASAASAQAAAGQVRPPLERVDAGPNVVQYALSTTNPVGTRVYDRGSANAGVPTTACQKYASPDRAQQAFLAAGGPNKDSLGLDSDGDGYACQWDPAPFRKAISG